jgi:hypothetical protein
MNFEEKDELLHKIARLTADNEMLLIQNKTLKSENELFKNEIATLKSLLSIYELSKKPAEPKEEAIEFKKHASLSYLRSEKFSRFTQFA